MMQFPVPAVPELDLNVLQELKKWNPDKNARFNVDTNGSILTGDYLDELVEAGMTDIGIDLKSLELDTFSRITGVDDKDLARKYLDTAWNAVKYLTDNYEGFNLRFLLNFSPVEGDLFIETINP